MPIGSINKEAGPKRETFRPPWVKDKDSEALPSWTQRKLKPVDNAKTAGVEKTEEPAPSKPTLKPALKKQPTIREKGKTENGDPDTIEEKLVKPSQAKQADRATNSAPNKFTRPTTKVIDKTKPEEKTFQRKSPEKSALKSVKINDEKPKEKTVTIVDKAKPLDRVKSNTVNTITTNDRNSTDKGDKKTPEGKDKSYNDITIKPIEKLSRKSIDKKEKSPEKAVIRNGTEKYTSKTVDKSKVSDNKDKPQEKKEDKNKEDKTKSTEKTKIEEKSEEKKEDKNKDKTKSTEKSKVEEKPEEKSKMATKPPTPLEKTPSKLPPRKPSLPKQMSKDDGPVKKWRDPLHERVKENIDKTLNEIPKGHTLTKNESLRSLLKPTPPPMPPPLPPKMPPPPEFKRGPLDPNKLKKLETLKSRPRKRPDWSDMMKEVEQGKKLNHVVCNDRSSPVITRSDVVKNKDQFIFESEKPNAHNDLLKEINKGIRLKKTKTNDRSKPNLEGLRKFRRQMTIEEQVQKSMSQANLLSASPSGVSVAEVPSASALEEEDIDEMDDIDKVRDDLQSTKQLLAIELRNKEVQERENKRLLTRIQNLEAELARERAIIKQEQHKTVISVTDAYDERLVNSLKSEVDRVKESADNIEKQYLDAAEDRDTAQTELEEYKRRNAELEKKLEQALSNKVEDMYLSEEPKSFFVQRQLDFEKQCRLLNIDVNSDEAKQLQINNRNDTNNNAYPLERTGHFNMTAYNYNNMDDEGIMPSNMGSRRSSHAIRQLSIQKDDSFEEEDESDEDEEESEEKKQKRLEREVKNMRNKIRHFKEKQDNMKRERAAYKMSLKNQQAALKNEKKKYKELKHEVDKMAAMMKEVGSDEEDEAEDSDSEESDEKKSESEEESESETEADTESETESESEPEDAPLPNKKENLTKRVKRHETRVNALKKGNALLMANVDRLKDDVNKQREESGTLQKELDSLIDDFA